VNFLFTTGIERDVKVVDCTTDNSSTDRPSYMMKITNFLMSITAGKVIGKGDRYQNPTFILPALRSFL